MIHKLLYSTNEIFFNLQKKNINMKHKQNHTIYLPDLIQTEAIKMHLVLEKIQRAHILELLQHLRLLKDFQTLLLLIEN